MKLISKGSYYLQVFVLMHINLEREKSLSLFKEEMASESLLPFKKKDTEKSVTYSRETMDVLNTIESS